MMPLSMEAKIRQLLATNELTEAADDILASLTPCIIIKPLEEEEGGMIGTSKFGGFPDLPQEELYPEGPGRLWSFLGQINLRELPSHGAPTTLPQQGLLYFFVSVDDLQPDRPVPPEAWAVRYRAVDEDNLAPAPLPDEMPRELWIPERKITFREEQQLPDVEASNEMENVYFDLLDQLYELEDRTDGYHQLFGQPLALTGDVLEQCRRASGNPSDHWLLLLQVDSDPEYLAGNWGPMGMLYFCMTKEDLATGRFENTWLVYQSH